MSKRNKQDREYEEFYGSQRYQRMLEWLVVIGWSGFLYCLYAIAVYIISK